MRVLKIAGITSLVLVALLALLIICTLLFGDKNLEEIHRNIVIARESIKNPEAQAYIETWINQHVVSNCEWRATGGSYLGAEEGETRYRDYPDFDWSILGCDAERYPFDVYVRPILVYGKYADPNPDGVMFNAAGRTGVIYSFGKHPTEFDSLRFSTKAEDFTQITDNIYYFGGSSLQ